MASAKKVEQAVTESRFVVIDGVQYSRPRAIRLGLLKAETAKPADGPSNSRARTSSSQRTATAPAATTAGAPAGTAPGAPAAPATGK